MLFLSLFPSPSTSAEDECLQPVERELYVPFLIEERARGRHAFSLFCFFEEASERRAFLTSFFFLFRLSQTH